MATQVQPVRGFNARALHLIDGENLVRGPLAEPDAIRRMWACYRGSVPSTSTDQFFVGGSRLFGTRAVPALPAQGVRLMVRDGADGGEDVLIESVDLDHLAARFGRVVIASADGRFAGLAGAARQRGLFVHVVATGPVSRRLRAVASTCARLNLGLSAAELAAHAPRPRLLAA